MLRLSRYKTTKIKIQEMDKAIQNTEINVCSLRVKFEVPMAVKKSMMVFWDVTPVVL
jgi:hypothetical protein